MLIASIAYKLPFHSASSFNNHMKIMRKLKWKTWKTHLVDQFLGVLPLFKINSKFLVDLRLLWRHGLPPLHRPALRDRHQPGGPQCGVYARHPATPRRPLATWPVPAGAGDAGNWSAMAANEGDRHGRHFARGERRKEKTQDTERNLEPKLEIA